MKLEGDSNENTLKLKKQMNIFLATNFFGTHTLNKSFMICYPKVFSCFFNLRVFLFDPSSIKLIIQKIKTFIRKREISIYVVN